MGKCGFSRNHLAKPSMLMSSLLAGLKACYVARGFEVSIFTLPAFCWKGATANESGHKEISRR